MNDPDVLFIAALERTALAYGWRPIEIQVAGGHRLTVTFEKDPLIEYIDALPMED